MTPVFQAELRELEAQLARLAPAERAEQEERFVRQAEQVANAGQHMMAARFAGDWAPLAAFLQAEGQKGNLASWLAVKDMIELTAGALVDRALKERGIR